MPKTIFEPFRIKSVEPIRLTTAEQRRDLMEAARLNVFQLRAKDVLIDLLTDSGTGAMSANQWAAIMQGDESYAGAQSFYRLETVIRRITGYPFLIPTHQGRAAERILFSVATKAGDIVPNNTHFDTTRANLEFGGAVAVDLVISEGLEPQTLHPFKGNIDLERVEELLKRDAGRVPFGMITITNNSGGGQPVSMANIRAYSELLKRYGKSLVMDVCRFAENAMFIKLREPGMEDRTIESIVQEMFGYADGCTMSAKKDGMVNIGGFIALRDSQWVDHLRNQLILTEGFPTYGGMAARDLEAIAVGLEEVLDENYLDYRLAVSRYMAAGLNRAGIPTVQPAGGHAVYIDAKAFLPHIPPEQFPGQALVGELYLSEGIRSCEIGSVMFGKEIDGRFQPSAMELVRLAFPRRVYTQSHFDYILEGIQSLAARKSELRGLRMSYRPPFLPHFTARFEVVG